MAGTSGNGGYSGISKNNNPGDSGNIFGDIPQGNRVPGDNGRTPLNPAAGWQVPHRIETNTNSFSKKTYSESDVQA
jgi:hypothetical protein